MILGKRLKFLRNELGLSQEAIGSQGFISVPGWIKIENGQRLPSDHLVHRLISWMIKDQYITASAAGPLREELLTLKYLSHPSPFVQQLAYHYARQLSGLSSILVSDDPGVYRVKRRSNRRGATTESKKGKA